MDAEEIARLVKDLRISGDTNVEAVTVTEEEAQKGLKRLESVVVGKIFSRRVITREMLRSNLPRILKARGSTDIEMVGYNLFVISFSLESDKRVALEEGPWHFFQDLMILKQSQAMQTPMEVDFDSITLWVQCHNPLECMTPSIIERIGSQVGNVEELDVGESGTCVGKFARVRVSRSISEPLVRCVPLKQEGSEKDVIVILQYEKLSDFFFFCGRVGHISRDYGECKGDKSNPRFEGWLRVGRSLTGRREFEVGFRDRSKASGSGDSTSRWVAIRPEVRLVEVESEKGDDGATGTKMGQGSGENERGKEDLEVNSAGKHFDVCMVDNTTGLGLPKAASVGGFGQSIGLSEVEGSEVGESEGISFRDKEGKGKEVALTIDGHAAKVGGKKWKRLARVSGGGMWEMGG